MIYRAPEPTPEQIENGKLRGYDPYDRCGALPYWDFSDDDTLAAPGVIHDEMTLRGGPPEQAVLVATNFQRDTWIVARAVDEFWKREFELYKAKVCAVMVWETIKKYWRAEDWNTDVTRAQGEEQMMGAKRHINECARTIGLKSPPYPEVGPLP